MVTFGNPLMSFGWGCSALQHEKAKRMNAETARSPLFAGLSLGALGEIRTPDPRIRSPMLYPAELRARKSFQWVSNGARTPGLFASDFCHYIPIRHAPSSHLAACFSSRPRSRGRIARSQPIQLGRLT